MDAQQTIGQIMHWALPMVPAGWHLCDGSILPIQTNQALYSLLGITYGGDGKVNFALPDLRGRIPVGINPYDITHYGFGKTGGTENVNLDATTTPMHTHQSALTASSVTAHGSMQVSTAQAVSASASATNNIMAAGYSDTIDPNGDNVDVFVFTNNAGTPIQLANAVAITVNANAATISLANTGNTQPHPNIQPYLAVNYIIALTGYYPLRP